MQGEPSVRKRLQIGEVEVRLFAHFALLTFLLGLFMANSARADTPIPLRSGAITDEQWAIIRAGLLGGDYPMLDADYVSQYGQEHGETTAEGALAVMRGQDIYVGYFDLDGDGTDEFIYHLDWKCGSIGCPTKVLEATGQGWQLILSI